MRILRHFSDVPPALKGAVVAIGNFDGVHLGHRALIQEAATQARTLGAPLVVLSFEPHPQEYFRALRNGGKDSSAGAECFRLTPLRVKARLLAELGADALLALPFNAAMARRTPEAFVHDVLVSGLGARAVVVGHDFEFGRGRAGNLDVLRALGKGAGFGVTAFDTVLTAAGGEKISSTRIRTLLKEARPQEAARLLGRWWAIEARVEHGDKRGRRMGFPTANMRLDRCLVPAFGIYAVMVSVMDNNQVRARHGGVASFGVRPMYRTSVPLLETHLFDFDADLYGKYLSVELIAWLRPEARFPDLDALIAQIGQDAAQARTALAAQPEPPA
jgi:riboflavin kinase/FMN adenylyltransferase